MSVLGLPLEEAVSRLEGAGYFVETVEARSMKGVDSPDSLRVIRQSMIGGAEKPTVQLIYSAFRTSVYPKSGNN